VGPAKLQVVEDSGREPNSTRSARVYQVVPAFLKARYRRGRDQRAEGSTLELSAHARPVIVPKLTGVGRFLRSDRVSL